jgi:predicted transcriptional regulator
MKYLTSQVKQQQLEWRRVQVLELASEGYSQREIAGKLHVDLAAVKIYSSYDSRPKSTCRSISMKQYQRNTKSVWLV